MNDDTNKKAIIKINDKEYDINDLTDRVKSYLAQIQLIDRKVMPMKAELAVFQTARDTYSQSLNAELEKIES